MRFKTEVSLHDAIMRGLDEHGLIDVNIDLNSLTLREREMLCKVVEKRYQLEIGNYLYVATPSNNGDIAGYIMNRVKEADKDIAHSKMVTAILERNFGIRNVNRDVIKCQNITVDTILYGIVNECAGGIELWTLSVYLPDDTRLTFGDIDAIFQRALTSAINVDTHAVDNFLKARSDFCEGNMIAIRREIVARRPSLASRFINKFKKGDD